MSPASRSLAKLRADGWTCAVTERWNAHAGVRQALFGFADLLSIRGDVTLAVQVTSGSNVAHRLTKLRRLPVVALWLADPHRRIVVHGWALRGPRGQRKTWQCREIILTPTELAGKERTDDEAQQSGPDQSAANEHSGEWTDSMLAGLLAQCEAAPMAVLTDHQVAELMKQCGAGPHHESAQGNGCPLCGRPGEIGRDGNK